MVVVDGTGISSDNCIIIVVGVVGASVSIQVSAGKHSSTSSDSWRLRGSWVAQAGNQIMLVSTLPSHLILS